MSSARQAVVQGDPRLYSSPEETLRRTLAMVVATKHHSMDAESAATLRNFFNKAEKNYRSISWPLSLRKFFR
jgi:hypothetical protein